MLITGQSVRAGTTDPSILHLILTMLRKWLLDPASAHLSAKELLVIIQRIAQVGVRRTKAGSQNPRLPHTLSSSRVCSWTACMQSL